ncbi:MAG: hypothetical protein QM642_06880 [Edaphocola sp.]
MSGINHKSFFALNKEYASSEITARGKKMAPKNFGCPTIIKELGWHTRFVLKNCSLNSNSTSDSITGISIGDDRENDPTVAISFRPFLTFSGMKQA